MPKTNPTLDEGSLTKGEDLGNEAFAKWYAAKEDGTEAADPNIALLEEALAPLIDKLRIPRGTAYALRRGRGRFIVEAVDIKE